MRLLCIVLLLIFFISSCSRQNPLDVLLSADKFKEGKRYIMYGLGKNPPAMAKRKNIYFKEGVLFIPKLKQEKRIDTMTLEIVFVEDSVPEIRTVHSLELPKGDRFAPSYAGQVCVEGEDVFLFQFTALNNYLEKVGFDLMDNKLEIMETFVEEYNQHKYTTEYMINFFQKKEWLPIKCWNPAEKIPIELGAMSSAYKDKEGNIYIIFEKGYYTKPKEIRCSEQVEGKPILSIQKALSERGYNNPLNNIMDSKTRSALVQFQKDNYLPVGNLNLETLDALGIKY